MRSSRYHRFRILLICAALWGCAHSASPEPKIRTADGSWRPMSDQEQSYYAYYLRLRAKLEPVWKEGMRQRRERLRKEQAGTGKETAGIEAWIGPAGELRNVKLVKTSRSAALDEAAADAMRKAGPFEPPPVSLLSPKTHDVAIRWDFVLEY